MVRQVPAGEARAPAQDLVGNSPGPFEGAVKHCVSPRVLHRLGEHRNTRKRTTRRQRDIDQANAAHPMTFSSIEEISDDEENYTFATNISAMFEDTRNVER